MKKYYWLKRRKPSARFISDYSNPNDLQDRYVSPPPVRFVDPPSHPVELARDSAQLESVQVHVDCAVVVKGVECEMTAGEVGVLSGNEPTEALKNKKPCIHQRFIASGNDMGHDPKYGGWINPYEGRWGQGSARKKKSYEYY
jgi:hypothetical protein